jgi:hypothetical protein
MDRVNSGQIVRILDNGFIGRSTWTWTVGGEIYASTTPGALTQTDPSATGDISQIVAVATSPRMIKFSSDFGNRFNENHMSYDYIVFQQGSQIIALSQDPAYDDETGTDFVTVVEAAYTNRAAVGARIKFFGDFDINSTLNFPTTANLDFYLIGNGMQNSVLTAQAGLGANVMLTCARVAWDSPQESTTVGIWDMTLDPNNIADSCLELPYTLCDIDRVRADADLAGAGNKVIGRLGGAGGPGDPSRIGKLLIENVSSDHPHQCLDLWYDNLKADHIVIAINADSAGLALINLNGEFYRFDLLELFHSPGGTIDNLITGSSVYLSAGTIATVTSGGGSTINGVLEFNAASEVVIEQLRLGHANHTPFKDATTQAATHIFGFGFFEKGTATILNGTTSIAVTHGLEYTPTQEDIMVMAGENPTNAVGSIWTSTFGAAQFTINCENDPGASNLDVVWWVLK